jgi:urea transporter
MARLASVDDDMVSNGLASYNGALVGCAFAVFLPGTWAPEIALASAVGGAFTPILAVALKNSLSMPQWTLAFNFTVLPPLLYHKPFSQPPPADAPAVIAAPCPTTLLTISAPRAHLCAGCARQAAEAAVTAVDWALSPLVGISQIFVVQNALSGALILGGIAVYSKEAAAHTLLGSSIGVATGVAMGADPSAITAGLWGFNPALTSLAVSVFFTPSCASLKPLHPPRWDGKSARFSAASRMTRGTTCTAVAYGAVRVRLQLGCIASLRVALAPHPS